MAPHELPSHDRVDVWHVPLDVPSARLEASKALLSPDERARMERYCFQHDQARFAHTRAVLRRLLGDVLGMPAAAVSFAYGPHGKPRVRTASMDVRFNVSHSHEVALIAIALGREVGIDVERRRAVPDAGTIARDSFPPSEAALGDEAFLELWTRKEAVLKASGLGLAEGLSDVEVGVRPLAERSVVALATHGSWSLLSFEPCEGYIAAVAAEGSGWELARHRAPD